MEARFLIAVIQGPTTQFKELVPAITSEDVQEVMYFDQAAEALQRLTTLTPQLILLDLQLNGEDAIELTKNLRNLNHLDNSCIVVFSDRKENYVQIMALNAGADDFIIKPVNKRVFVSRFTAWSRKYNALKATQANGKGNGKQGVSLDFDKYTLVQGKKEILLQRKEFEIIALLYARPGKIFSRVEIKTNVWGIDHHVRNRTIDVHIRNLRSKIGDGLIKTYKGIGYSYDSEAR